MNSLKVVIALLFLFNSNVVAAQNFSYPQIKKEGSAIADFIPAGWSLYDSASGDLNADNLPDLVIVLQHTDSVTILKAEDGYTDTVTTQPRILCIIFRTPISNRLLLAERSNTFILQHDNPTMDDPFGGVQIKKGVLQINFRLFYSMGSWYVTSTSYKFRYQQKEFVLIGADYHSFHRASHDFTDCSYNFLSKKWSETKGTADAAQKPRTVWRNLNLKTLKTLKTFKQPFTWEVTKDVYL